MGETLKTAINVETEKALKRENLRGALKKQRKTACLTKLTTKAGSFERQAKVVIRALTDACRCL